jgi:hypothetical protein
MNTRNLALAALLTAWAAASLPADDAKGKTEPAGVPLSARLVVNKDTYKLDVGGKSADELQKMLAEAKERGDERGLPKVPEIDLTFVLTNSGDKEIEIQVEGDNNRIMMDLKGPAVLPFQFPGGFTADFRMPKPLKLAPGKSYEIPLKSLRHGFRGMGDWLYWAKPGEYTLAVSFTTAVKPIPKGAEDQDGYGKVVVTTAPVKLKVTDK